MRHASSRAGSDMQCLDDSCRWLSILRSDCAWGESVASGDSSVVLRGPKLH
jgi:hypothetical protein